MCIFGLDPKMHKKDHGCEEDGLTPSCALLKFLKLAWQSEIALLKHEKFQPFRVGGRPGGHFFKAERVFLSILVKRLSKQIASGD
jgi:hypothetical protein